MNLLILCVSALNVSMASAQVPLAAKYSAEHSGDAVLVYRGDSLVFEEYQNGWIAGQAHQLASGTKTFTCVLRALNPQHPQNPQITQIGADSVLRGVTVAQLLNLTSGISVDEDGRLVRVSAPGQKFAYGGVSFALYGMLLRQKLGEDLVAYLTRTVFNPIGMKVGSWQRDEAGNPGLASGAALTARDWGKFGVLLLQRGKWNGRQLVPAAGLAECAKGSAANPFYGLGVWLNPVEPTTPPPAGVERAGPKDRTISAPDLPHDLWLAAGSGGQRLYILPTQGMVIVRFGHNTGPDYRDDEFLRILLRRQEP